MSTIEKAKEFITRKHRFKTTSDRIIASREAKSLVLSLNEKYKVSKSTDLMNLMKEITVIKQKIEKRLKGKPLTAGI